jgi:hypothetical protein
VPKTDEVFLVLVDDDCETSQTYINPDEPHNHPNPPRRTRATARRPNPWGPPTQRIRQEVAGPDAAKHDTSHTLYGYRSTNKPIHELTYYLYIQAVSNDASFGAATSLLLPDEVLTGTL